MKKNILTVVIMASCLINLVLSAVLVFTVMPAMNKTTSLVNKVASVIDLEIEDPDDEEQEYTIADLLTYSIDYENSLKINLAKDSGGEAHYAVLDGVVVSFNSKAEDYADVSTAISTTDIYVQDVVKETIAQYNVNTVDESKIRQESVKKLQEKYNTKCIVDISIKGFLIA